MSLAMGDLTTLSNVKAYIANPPSDTVITSLITRLSRNITSVLNRGLIVPKTYTQQFSGQWTRQLVLPNWPLLSISSIYIGGVNLPISPQVYQVNSGAQGSPCYGYRFQPWNGNLPGSPAVIDLEGAVFYGGLQNVVATYTAGYQITGEIQTIPSGSSTLTPESPSGTWATDQGVTYVSSGAALTPVATSPGIGQYVPPSPSGESPVNVYTFNAGDEGNAVSLNYGFIPYDLEQAVMDFIAERAAYRTRVGIRSQSLASQEATTYDNSSIPAYIVEMIRPYESVLPPAIGAPV